LIEKAILNHQEDGLVVKIIENKGRGVFADKPFYKDDFIVEYAGELIPYQEAKDREKKYSEDPTIGCYMYFFEFKTKKYCIDATAESGRLGRLLNHSKAKNNCHTKLYEINSKPVLAILASRDIKLDEELTYDYGDRDKFTLEAHPWLLT
jgi:[histone H4]-lysine20 N-methyltransferase SETD8